jgi:hypothetical protein
LGAVGGGEEVWVEGSGWMCKKKNDFYFWDWLGVCFQDIPQPFTMSNFVTAYNKGAARRDALQLRRNKSIVHNAEDAYERQNNEASLRNAARVFLELQEEKETLSPEDWQKRKTEIKEDTKNKVGLNVTQQSFDKKSNKQIYSRVSIATAKSRNTERSANKMCIHGALCQAPNCPFNHPPKHQLTQPTSAVPAPAAPASTAVPVDTTRTPTELSVFDFVTAVLKIPNSSDAFVADFDTVAELLDFELKEWDEWIDGLNLRPRTLQKVNERMEIARKTLPSSQ